MEIPNPGRSTVELQGLNMKHNPSSAREAVENGGIAPMEHSEVKRHLRELSKLVYSHKKMAPFYHSDICNGKSALAFCLCAIHGQRAPQPLAPHSRMSSLSSGKASVSGNLLEKRKSSPCKSVRPGSTCELPELLESTADLSSWDSLYYALSAEIRQLYRDVEFRITSGFANHFTIVHHFGWAATLNESGTPFTLLNLATILERGWDIINRPELVAALDRAVRERNAKLPRHQSSAKQFSLPHLTQPLSPGCSLYTSLEGLCDINKLAPEMIVGMLWHEQDETEQRTQRHAAVNNEPLTSSNVDAANLTADQMRPGDIIAGRKSSPPKLTQGSCSGNNKTPPAPPSASSQSPTTPHQHSTLPTTMAPQHNYAEEQRQVSPHGELAFLKPHLTCTCTCSEHRHCTTTTHKIKNAKCFCACSQTELTKDPKAQPMGDMELQRRKAELEEQQAALDRERREIERAEEALRRNQEAFNREQREREQQATMGQFPAAGGVSGGQEVGGAGVADIAHNFDRALAPARQYADQQRLELAQFQQRARAESNLGHLVHVPDQNRPRTPSAGVRKQKHPINLELYGGDSGQRYPSEAMARPSVTAQPPPVWGQAASLPPSTSGSTLRGAPAATALMPAGAVESGVPRQSTPTRGERFGPYDQETALSTSWASTDNDSSSEGLSSPSIRRKPVGSSSGEQMPSRRVPRAIEGEENPNDTFVFPDFRVRGNVRSQAIDDDDLPEDLAALQPAPLRLASNTMPREALVQRIVREEQQETETPTEGEDELTMRPSRVRAATQESNTGQSYYSAPRESAHPHGYGGSSQQAVTDYGTYNPYAADDDDTALPGTAVTTPEMLRTYNDAHTGYHPYPQAYSQYPNPYNTGSYVSSDQVPSYRERSSSDIPPAYAGSHSTAPRRPSDFKTPENKLPTHSPTGYTYTTAPSSQHASTTTTSSQLHSYGTLSQSRTLSSTHPSRPPIQQRYVSAGGTIPLHQRSEVPSPFVSHNTTAPLVGAETFPQTLTTALEELQIREKYGGSGSGSGPAHTPTSATRQPRHVPIEVPAVGGRQPDAYGWEQAFADGELRSENREKKEKPRKESNASSGLRGIKNRIFSRSGSAGEGKDGKDEGEGGK
ncbi:hypothetical protein MBLNU230_g2638t1 [Neophaeotheca triangularis]